ncbi:MAG TPA: YdcF family protein [Steroidobacteraceae bacterium]|nr:YdcF family protein [Steroidobacteraceae bacterium]
MFVTLKMLLGTLLLPPAGPLLLSGAGLSLLVRRPPGEGARKAALALVATGMAALWLLSTPVVAEALMRLAERYPALDLARPLSARAVVILGGGRGRAAPEYGGPAAGLELLERVSYGAYVARRTGLPVLVSGTADEALAMRATLSRDFGITPRWLNGQSRDTFDDAQYSARLLRADGIERIVLVTSAGHEWRAVHEFSSAGLAVEPAPVHVWAPHPRDFRDYLPDALGMLQSREALHEIVGDVARPLLAATRLRRHET